MDYLSETCLKNNDFFLNNNFIQCTSDPQTTPQVKLLNGIDIRGNHDYQIS